MKPVWTKEVDEILGIGIQLSEIGLSNWALTKSQAMHALEQLEALKISILGGDVCQYIDGVIKPNYDSWYCEPISTEPKSESLNRSIAKAKKYMELYQAKEPDKVFFVLVPDI